MPADAAKQRRSHFAGRQHKGMLVYERIKFEPTGCGAGVLVAMAEKHAVQDK
jgi:hypothetical protein